MPADEYSNMEIPDAEEITRYGDTSRPDLWLALQHVNGVGPVLTRKLISHFGSIESMYDAGASALRDTGVRAELVNQIFDQKNIDKAKAELDDCLANNIRLIPISSREYPFRLKECPDAPSLLFYRGNCSLNAPKMVAVVGTRKMTRYGRYMTQNLVKELCERHSDLVIVAGLAYGVDICAQRMALETGASTVAVMGTSLFKVYPKVHKKDADNIELQGGLLSEYPRDHRMLPSSFVQRNRIIAGLCDAVLVVESGKDGGALSTAELANGYGREVFAVPGRATDLMSEGCNAMIHSNKAVSVTCAGDVETWLNWDNVKVRTNENASFPELMDENLPEEQLQIVHLLREKGNLQVNDMAKALGTNIGSLQATLFTMEFNGIVHLLPGSVYGLGR